MSASAGRLLSVEVARGLAALAVVVFHANASARWFGGPRWAALTPLAHGVDFFFVLSGFIIAFVHGADVGTPRRLRPFLIKRAVRLLPLLWLAVGLATIGHWALGGAVDWHVVVRSTLLLPVQGEFAPDVVWTLRHEALFYLVFAVAVLSRRSGAILASVMLFGSVAQLVLGWAGRPLSDGWAVVLSAYNFDFALGALVAFAATRPPRRPAAWLWGGLAASTVLLTHIASAATSHAFVTLLDWQAMVRALALGLAFSCTLRGLVALDGGWSPSAFWLGLGTSSYAVYLFHTLANAAVQRLVVQLPAGALRLGAGHLVLVVTGVLVGVALDRWFDRPVRRFVLPRLLSSKATAGASGPPPL